MERARIEGVALFQGLVVTIAGLAGASGVAWAVGIGGSFAVGGQPDALRLAALTAACASASVILGAYVAARGRPLRQALTHALIVWVAAGLVVAVAVNGLFALVADALLRAGQPSLSSASGSAGAVPGPDAGLEALAAAAALATWAYVAALGGALAGALTGAWLGARRAAVAGVGEARDPTVSI